jgi:Holliday junction resolvase RusA-like endonuclease
MTITFFVPGQPVAKGRPIAGRGFNGRTTLRTPEKTANYENLVAVACAQAMAGMEPIPGPLAVIFSVTVQTPASWSKKRQQRANDGAIGATKKPDIDNIVKALCDAMNGIAYKDDAQIIELTVTKHYGNTPGVHVRLYPKDKEAA